MKKLTQKAVIEDLQSVANRMGHVPTRKQYRARKNKSHVASSTIEEVFNGSWSKAAKRVRL